MHATSPRARVVALMAATAFTLAACGSTTRHPRARPSAARTVATSSGGRPAPVAVHRTRAALPPVRALVTAQTEDRLLSVDLPSGRVVREVAVAGEPEYVATTPNGAGGLAVVVSAAAGTVTLLDLHSLRPIKVFRGFVSPHIPEIFPDGDYAYVTDDASGKVTVIGLYDHRILSRVAVGAGAHHLAFSPNWREAWIALGQSAGTIAILSTIVRMPPSRVLSPVGDPGHPHLAGYFHPGFLAHDLRFTPDGRRVWITSASTRYVGVFSARSRRLLFRVPAGPPPQHLAFAGRFAYITSGYGSTIEKVMLADGRVLRQVHAPYGSFDLDAAGPYVVTSSLLHGTLAIYDDELRLLHVRQLAPSTEDVAIVRR